MRTPNHLSDADVQKESKPSRTLKTGVAVTLLTLTAAAAGFAAGAASNRTHKESEALRTLKWEVAHTYEKVQLTSAKINGDDFNASTDGADREAVAIHINSTENKALAIAAADRPPYWGDNQEDGVGPVELVVGPDNSTERGIVKWVGDSTDDWHKGDAEMQVLMRPYAGEKETTRKYRIFLPSIGFYDGQQIAGLHYAGTVEVSGANGELNQAQIVREASVPKVQVVNPPDGQNYLGPGINTESLG